MKIGEVYDSLSPIRQAIYDFAKEFEAENGTAVTVRDISAKFGIAISNVYFHLRRLCELGLMYQDGRKHFRVKGSLIDVIMPDENMEIQDAMLDEYHLTTKWEHKSSN